MENLIISIINYENEEEVLEYVKMIALQTFSSRISVAIVNNCESSKPEIDLRSELEKIDLSTILLNPGENLGYLNGGLFGFRELMKNQKNKPSWFLISNTDIKIDKKNFFESIMTNKYDDNIWCLAPSVYSTTNKSYDNPHYISRTSIQKINMLIFINDHPFLAYAYGILARLKAKANRSEKKNSQFVYSVHGCFFLLKNEFYEVIKDKDYKGFLYSEEAYVAEMIKKAGKKCYYDSEIEIIHNENSVTGLLSVKKRARFISNSLRFLRKEFYNDYGKYK